MGRIAVGRGTTRGTRRPPPPHRAEVWKFLCAYMKERNGRSPSAREIANGAGVFSLGSVDKTLRQLEREGLIRLGRFGTARAIEIVGARYLLPGERLADGEAGTP